MAAIDIKRENVADYNMYSFHNPGACARAKHNMCTAQDHQRAQGRARSQHVAAVKHEHCGGRRTGGTARSEREVRGAGEGYTAADGAKPATPEKRMPHVRLRNTLAL
jgi:hypothetical protein